MKNEIVSLTEQEVEKRIIELRGTKVLLDSDVAMLYGVETKRVNEAVRNNPDKFPKGYIIELTDKEMQPLRSKFSTANISSKVRVNAKAFTEKGLYMLDTILKSPKSIEETDGDFTESESTVELNLAILKVKRTVKKRTKD